MRIQLNLSDVLVLEPDDCRELDVLAPAADRAEVARRLEQHDIGRWHDERTVALSLPRLFELASSSSGIGADWIERWHSMLEYALSRGWLDPEADEVLAHVASTPGSDH